MSVAAGVVPGVRAGLVCLFLLPAATVSLAAPLGLPEPVMQLTSQLSAANANETERDLLRGEYRLSQKSIDFWLGFDGLNARIHGAAENVRALRGLIEGTPPPAPPSLLAGLLVPMPEPVRPGSAPAANSLPDAAMTQKTVSVTAEPTADGAAWWVAGALGMLALVFLRLRGARYRPAAKMPAPATASLPAHAPSRAQPPAAAAEVVKQEAPPSSVSPPSPPIDLQRAELDHALDLAEVMLSYGRTGGAMQTLKDHLDNYPTASVRPWLKLLELFRQTGMREDFERAAATVHGHFNVRVPGWDEGVAGEPLRSFFDDEERTELLCLEQIPHILAKVQATWPGPACLDYLRHLLADNRDGERLGFPVSVVAEILLLEDILIDRMAGRP
jgi:hypothetical protein